MKTDLPMQIRFRPNQLLLCPLCVLFLGCADAATPLEYELVQTYAHNEGNFTQGLTFHEGKLYEGTGQYGDSRLIIYRDDFETPAVTRALANRYFGEGITVHQDLLYQLTWKSGTAFSFGPEDLSRTGSFSYEGEGWGITSGNERLWISNGGTDLIQLSNEGELINQLAVTLDDKPLNFLNELEWIDGSIYANRWYDNNIYRIDPDSGEVTGVINLELIALAHQSDRNKVLNGIAWNPERQTLWVTGKYWNEIYELRLID
jgi:glutamine cyclotransferase